MSLLFLAGKTPAQAPVPQLERSSGQISDFAQVVDAATKRRLEHVLLNFQQESGIEFVIATIKSPGNQDLYDYSMRLATNWNVGAPASKQRSMLLLVETDGGKFWIQSSRVAQANLPDGLVGVMGRRMRPQFQTADYNGGLITGIQTFIDLLGSGQGFSFAQMDLRAPESKTPSPASGALASNQAEAPAQTDKKRKKKKEQASSTQTVAASTAEPVNAEPAKVTKPKKPKQKKEPQTSTQTAVESLTTTSQLQTPLRQQTQAHSGSKEGVAELRGQVVDAFGGLIVGSTITVTSEEGVESKAVSDSDGNYVLPKLAPGNYHARATAPGFAVYENPDLEIAPGRSLLDIQLEVTIEKQEVTVSVPVGNSLTMRVLRGEDLEALPAGAGGLAASLRVLAFPSTGPRGRQILVDGFAGGRLPPKNSIREIRISDNPFSSEYSEPGFGRIEILTKPGSNTLHLSSFFSFNDESLNSRNPFAPNRAPYQSRQYGGSVSGPIIPKRSSFFVDFERRSTEDNAIINATILDPALNIVPFSRSIQVPQQDLRFSPRVDFQLNRRNTLVARYAYRSSREQNEGVGGFSLLSRAANNFSSSHTFQLTETSVLSPSSINETRFQYVRSRRGEHGDASTPAILVPESFTGGGAETARAFHNEDRWELQNYTSWILGKHNLKAGAQLRGIRLLDSSRRNFNGLYTFAGGFAPQLDVANNIVRDENGRPVIIPITSIERYRRTLFFLGQGLDPEATRALGGGATQFSIAGGNPEARVSQYDVGAFVQDDLALRPNLTLSAGMRYEAQNNIGNNLNFAPRIAFAWSPGDAKQSKTVIRSGLGVFFDRFGENYVLQANRFNGDNQQRFIVSDPDILNLFPTVPLVEQLSDFAVPQAVTRVASDLRSPYTIQFSLSVERELPLGFSLSSTFIKTRSLHMLRSRNINAPLPGTFVPDLPRDGLRPFGNIGDIFQFESSGRFDQTQLVVNAVERFRKVMTLWATYVLSKASSDTDGPGSFPLDSYNLSSEFGPSALDARHGLYVGGWIAAPWGISVNPLIFVRSGLPFNITTGRDTNGDSLYTERPALATNLNSPTAVVTPFGAFDLSPTPGQELIPRNYGRGPGFFSVNLGLSKSFAFGSEAKSAPKTAAQRGRRQAADSRFGDWFSSRSYKFTITVQVENLFNHTNPGLPVGNLSSPLFGRSYWSAGAFGFGNNASGNRRIELQGTLSF